MKLGFKGIFSIAAIAVSLLCAIGVDAQSPRNSEKIGVVLLAHGGRQNWNEEVAKVAEGVDKTYITEVAFGMATKRNIQTAIDKLITRGATRIVAVPLFVSSNSSVVTSSEYLLGLRAEAPKDLAIFAKMDHGSGTSGGHDSHAGHAPAKDAPVFDPTTPVNTSVPIKMTPALNDHRIVSEILTARANALSTDPSNEAVIVVAHGPVSDETNRLWLRDMGSLAEMMKPSTKFDRIDYLTVRDDAPEPIRSKATEELRAIVKKALGDKKRVLIVPLLISYGGIEEGIKKRLDGLQYTMGKQALLPDARLVDWVILSVDHTKVPD